jgi:hypothetical protein
VLSVVWNNPKPERALSSCLCVSSWADLKSKDQVVRKAAYFGFLFKTSADGLNHPIASCGGFFAVFLAFFQENSVESTLKQFFSEFVQKNTCVMLSRCYFGGLYDPHYVGESI